MGHAALAAHPLSFFEPGGRKNEPDTVLDLRSGVKTADSKPDPAL
jgi:hypothetical protein